MNSRILFLRENQLHRDGLLHKIGEGYLQKTFKVGVIDELQRRPKEHEAKVRAYFMMKSNV